MSYTQEQLAKMSDTEVEMAMSELLGSNPRPFNQDEYDNLSGDEEEYLYSRTIVPAYCTDWSATGPLMVEYDVASSPTKNNNEWCAELPWGEIDMFSVNQNPLRAICEVILMLEKA